MAPTFVIIEADDRGVPEVMQCGKCGWKLFREPDDRQANLLVLDARAHLCPDLTRYIGVAG